MTQYVKSFAYEQKMAKEKLNSKWWDQKTYMDRINNTPGLKELIGAPFLLRMFVAILPNLRSEKITVLALYRDFVAYSFDRQLKKQNAYQGEMQLYKVQDAKEYMEFACKLAAMMMQRD